MHIDTILRKPIITEKTMLAAQQNKFTFEVDRRANKHQIAQAINTQFGVNVIAVTTLHYKGKEKRFGTRRYPARLSATKKAVAELKAGQKIDIFDIKQES